MDQISIDLSSITGVVAATGLIIEIVKRTPIAQMSWFSKIPVFVYSLVIAAALSLLANKGLHLLTGDTYHVIWQAMLSAASASGFYTWLRNPENLTTVGKIAVAATPANTTTGATK